MGFWWWVLVFVGIAVAGLGLFALLGLRLWRKSKVLFAELARLSETMAATERELQSVGAPAGATARRVHDLQPDSAEWAAAARSTARS